LGNDLFEQVSVELENVRRRRFSTLRKKCWHS
jgi:hypothetical protein